MSSTNMGKKTKGKKATDPNETSKLLAAKISQLEQDAAGEKDQEQEIGAFIEAWMCAVVCGDSVFKTLHVHAFRLKQT